MRKYLIILSFVLAAVTFAAAPNKETNQMIVFTDSGQATTTNFKIDTIVWTSAPGSTAISTGCDLSLTDTGDSTDIIKLAGTTQVVGVGGLNVNGITASKSQGQWCGRVYIYGNRR